MKSAILLWSFLLIHLSYAQNALVHEIKCNDITIDSSVISLFNTAYVLNKLTENDTIKSSGSVNERLTVPEKINKEVILALSHFPELKDDRINFRYKRIRLTMNARPDVLNIFRTRSNRKYIILINNNKGRHKGINLNNISFNSRVGWYAHELGHIYHYHEMTNLQTVAFSVKYVISSKYVRKVERFINEIAIQRGLLFQIYEGEILLSETTAISSGYKRKAKFNSLSGEEFICLWWKNFMQQVTTR